MPATSLRDLQAALNKKSGFEVVDHSESEGRLRLMGRQPKDRLGVNLNNWLLVVRSLLRRSPAAPWKVDISKEYFLRGEQVLYGWRLLFQGEDIASHYEDIFAAIMNAEHTSRGELTEFPLPGGDIYQRGKNISSVREGGGGPTGRG